MRWEVDHEWWMRVWKVVIISYLKVPLTPEKPEETEKTIVNFHNDNWQPN
jgi:hypothetical protein